MTAVLQRLREDLAARRAAGEPFDHAWPIALAAAAPPGDPEGWHAALHATRQAWASAYARRPSHRRERAVLALAVDPDREPISGDDRCPHCGDELPPSRGPGPPRIYCSTRCGYRAQRRAAA